MDSSNIPIKRRLVDLNTLGSELKCNICQLNLSLLDVEDEHRYRLASKLTIKCQNCQTMKMVRTIMENMTNRSFEVNGKATFSMMDTGIGASHFNAMLATQDLEKI
ncbi:hypothetical protein TKK_0012486 [Trichogramma kaykai]